MKKIYLIGFMGSGKSTIGLKLAKSLNKSFVDIDQYIEETYEQQISKIFAEKGEKTFRNYEIKALKETTDFDVVATGGGVVEKEENIDLMNKELIIYLETAFEAIVSRLQNDETRPLWNISKDNQKSLFKQRSKKYEKIAHKIITTTNKEIDQIVTEILSYIKNS